VIFLSKDCCYEWSQEFKYGVQQQDNAVWSDQVCYIVIFGSTMKAEYLIRENPK
jgi:hypothetical protein